MPKETPIRGVAARGRAVVNLLWREAAKFGLVGGLGWLIDNGIYTYLWHGPMSGSTIKARIASTAIATLFSWFANRYWTFRHRRSQRAWKEFMMFLVMNGIGLIIVLACQIISRNVLGFTSFTADFIAGGIIGLALGTAFRFLAYRFFVFNEELDHEPGFRTRLRCCSPSPGDPAFKGSRNGRRFSNNRPKVAAGASGPDARDLAQRMNHLAFRLRSQRN
jgi:putative flippase GtrA